MDGLIIYSQIKAICRNKFAFFKTTKLMNRLPVNKKLLQIIQVNVHMKQFKKEKAIIRISEILANGWVKRWNIVHSTKLPKQVKTERNLK